MKQVEFSVLQLSDTVSEFRAKRCSAPITDKVLLLSVIAILFLLVAGVVYEAPVYMQVIVSVIIGIVVFSHLSYVVEESVLIIRDFGVQLRLKYTSGQEYTKFLYRDKINSIFIHEYIKGSAVYYSLAFTTYGEDRINMCFTEVYPGLQALVKIYNTFPHEKK